jgi:transcriptional regulator with XRE-family HTH domain
MKLSSLSDIAAIKELGGRIRRYRLNLDVTQEDLAEKAGVARSVVQKIEQGEPCMLDGWLRVLRALDVLDQLDAFLPDPGFSPLQLVRMQDRERQRASGKRGTDEEGVE